MTWLRHDGPDFGPGQVLAGPGAPAVRGARRVSAVLTAVRGMTSHAVSAGQAPGHLMPLLYEVADDRDLPVEARGEEGRMSFRLRARHRLREDECPVDRASDAFDEFAFLERRSCPDQVVSRWQFVRRRGALRVVRRVVHGDVTWKPLKSVSPTVPGACAVMKTPASSLAVTPGTVAVPTLIHVVPSVE